MKIHIPQVIHSKDVWVFKSYALSKNTPCIYALIDSRDNKIRYVGKSLSGIDRGYRHLNKSNLKIDGNTKKANWVKNLKDLNLKPIVGYIKLFNQQDFSSKDELNLELYKQEQCFIKYLRTLKYDLTNATDGGPGATGRQISDVTRQKMSKSAKKYPLNPALVKQSQPIYPVDKIESGIILRWCSAHKDYFDATKLKTKQKLCGKCKHKRFFKVSINKKENIDKARDKVRILVTMTHLITKKEIKILGIKKAARFIGDKCNKTGIRNAIKFNTIYYNHYWSL